MDHEFREMLQEVLFQDQIHLGVTAFYISFLDLPICIWEVLQNLSKYLPVFPNLAKCESHAMSIMSYRTFVKHIGKC